MKTKKQAAVWMDHANAHVMSLTGSTISSTRIASDFTHQKKEFALSKNENLMHNKEQHQQAEYYLEITKALLEHQDILLFGPTEAKNELANLLKANKHFTGSKIEIKQSDKLTENQQHAFVKKHFNVE